MAPPTVVVIDRIDRQDLVSRRVQILGTTPHPEALFMQQIVRMPTMAEDCAGHAPQIVICDRDRKWSGDVRRRLWDAGIRVVLIPEAAPNANAYAERFVRSIKEECLDRLIPIGSGTFGGPWRSTPSTTTANGITRVSTTGSPRARRCSG
jgi:transposase InsO family protein